MVEVMMVTQSAHVRAFLSLSLSLPFFDFPLHIKATYIRPAQLVCIFMEFVCVMAGLLAFLMVVVLLDSWRRGCPCTRGS